VRDLCEALGTSWRALDSGFREVYGISPGSYLRIVRLHGVRRALRAADPAGTSVTDIATGWGFFHFGRFSGEYRRLFGEAPSDTLWKRRPSRS
jgi:AraC family ethanolamine operon transcriptional activator